MQLCMTRERQRCAPDRVMPNLHFGNMLHATRADVLLGRSEVTSEPSAVQVAGAALIIGGAGIYALCPAAAYAQLNQ